MHSIFLDLVLKFPFLAERLIVTARIPIVEMNLTRNHEVVGSILASLSGSRIWCCPELWCRLQMRLRSGVAVAVAVAGRYSSNWTPSLGTSMCREFGPKKQKKKKRKGTAAKLVKVPVY